MLESQNYQETNMFFMFSCKKTHVARKTPQYLYGLTSLYLLTFFQPGLMLVTWNDRMLDRDVYILWQFFVILICWSKICSSMLLQARCHCTSGVGVCRWMCSGCDGGIDN